MLAIRYASRRGVKSNSPHLLDALNKRCFGRRRLCSRRGGGAHQVFLGKVARQVAIFSDAMCEIIPSGLSAQMKADRCMRDNERGVNHVMLEGSVEVNDYFMSVAGEPADMKSRPLVFAASQRGTMPGEVVGGQEASAVISPRSAILCSAGSWEAHSRHEIHSWVWLTAPRGSFMISRANL